MSKQKTGLLQKLYSTANDYEKKHYREAVLKHFGFTEKNFYNWIKTHNSIEAVSLWQYCFSTLLVEDWIWKSYQFHKGGITKYKEPELFDQI